MAFIPLVVLTTVSSAIVLAATPVYAAISLHFWLRRPSRRAVSEKAGIVFLAYITGEDGPTAPVDFANFRHKIFLPRPALITRKKHWAGRSLNPMPIIIILHSYLLYTKNNR